MKLLGPVVYKLLKKYNDCQYIL